VEIVSIVLWVTGVFTASNAVALITKTVMMVSTEMVYVLANLDGIMLVMNVCLRTGVTCATTLAMLHALLTVNVPGVLLEMEPVATVRRTSLVLNARSVCLECMETNVNTTAQPAAWLTESAAKVPPEMGLVPA